MDMLGVALLVLMTIGQVSCNASVDLEEMIDEFYAWRIKEYPEFATSVGIYDNADKINDLSEATFTRQKNEADAMLTKARGLSTTGLDSQERVSLKMIIKQLESFTSGYDYRTYSIYNMLSPLSRPTSYVRGLFGLPKNTELDYQRLLSRLRHIETYIDQRITLMTEAIRLNRTSHITSLTGTIELIDEEITSNPADSYYYNTLFNRTKPDAIPQNIWDGLKAEGLNVTRYIVNPSWQRFSDFLKNEYTPNTRPQEGVGSLAGGYDYYAECLKWHTGTNLSPQEVHNIGLQEVERISKLMQVEMDKEGFTGSLQDYIEKVKTDPENHFNDSQSMLDGYQYLIDRVKPLIPQIFKNAPTSDCRVQASSNPASSMGSYSSPSASRPYGVFWANVFEPETKSRGYMVALTLHEAEPGHHTQLAYVYEKLGHLPMFRKRLYSLGSHTVPFNWPTFTAHTEGWALYSEALGEQMGVYDWKYSLFERYGSEIFRAVRLVVDTGVHVMGWTKEQAMEYKANYTTRSAQTIENDINRYISWPGQACAYKIGQLKIEELREKASNELGSRFKLPEFNELLSKYGRIPLDVLEEVVDEWILEKKEILDPSTYIKNLYDEYMEWRIKENPELGTRIGRHERDDKVTDYTEEAFVRSKNIAEQFLERANEVSEDGLTKQERIDFKVFKNMLQTYVEGFEFRKHSIYNHVSPLWDTPTSHWNSVYGGLLYNTVDDYRLRAFKRMLLLDTYVEQRMTLMAEAINLNMTSHETALVGIIEKIEGEEIVADAKDSPVYKRFFSGDPPPAINSTEWASLKTDCEQMITNTYIPAWRRFRDFLRDIYKPNLRKNEGAWAMPNGLAYYEAALKWHLTFSMTADDVHQKGLEEVARISKQMEDIAKADGFSGTLKEYLQYLKTLPGNFYNNSADMLDGYRDIVARVNPTLQRALNNLPDVECKVEGDDDPQGVIASYSGPSSSRPYGVFRVNIYEPQIKPKSDMVSLTLHEAEPGHHTHYAYMFEKLQDRSRIRTQTYYAGRTAAPFTWPIFSSYTEGWALYAESLGEMLGVYDGDLHSLFGRYSWEIFRAIRLVVDTGMHAKGWTKRQAMDYIAEYTTFTEYTNENEVNRYISWPGQACAYKIGQIKIEELRDRAIAALGDDFDLREFHDQFLQLGTVPLEVVEEFIDEWIDHSVKSRENKYLVEKLFEDYVNWRLEENPEWSTSIGLHTHEDQISEWTEEAFQKTLETGIQFLNRAESISREGLDEQTALHLDVLEERFRILIRGFPYRKYSRYNDMRPAYPPTQAWTGLLGSMKYETIDDYEKAFYRMGLLEQYVDQRIELMNQSIASGLTMHKHSLYQIPEKMGDAIVTKANDSDYYRILFNREIPVGITNSQWEELRTRASGIIMNTMVPAWQKFKSFLDNEYMPNTRPWEGAWSLPGGIDYYRECLRHFTTTNLSPEEIHQIGLDEVDRISKEMDKIMAQDGFSGTLQEYIASLRNDPNNFYDTEDEMIAGYEEIIRDTHDKVSKVLLNVPQEPIDVVKATNPQASGGSYSSPPLDGSRNGRFTANVFEPKTKIKLTMVSLTLHEAEPGHHTQITYSVTRNNLPLWRRKVESVSNSGVPYGLPRFTAFVEGWALYAETLGIEMEAFDETKWPHCLFGMYVSEMFRAVRLVVDTGIHAFGWSKERAIEYAMNYTTYAESRVDNEINRYISQPGQAVAYKIGQMFIAQQRDKAMNALGSQFDIREYNDQVLQVGAAPLPILEKRIDQWIVSKGGVVTPSPGTTQSTTPRTTPTTGSGHRNIITIQTVLLAIIFSILFK